MNKLFKSNILNTILFTFLSLIVLSTSYSCNKKSDVDLVEQHKEHTYFELISGESISVIVNQGEFKYSLNKNERLLVLFDGTWNDITFVANEDGTILRLHDRLTHLNKNESATFTEVDWDYFTFHN